MCDAAPPEETDDEWTDVEVSGLEKSASFRFREDEDGEFEVEVYLEDEADQERVQWYARGFLAAYTNMMESFDESLAAMMQAAGAAMAGGADGDEEE